jgi:cystathionine beta-synthase
VLRHEYVDFWLKADDATSFAMTRRLIRTEGMLCGGSSGSAMVSALRFLKEDPEGKKIAATPGANIVVLLPDRCVADSFIFFFFPIAAADLDSTQVFATT